MTTLYIDILKENINVLNLSARWVQRSYEQARGIELNGTYTEEEFDKLEVLTSRYARTTDMLVNKVLRSLDTVESEDIGTIIDIMNRAEKRGIVQSAEILHTIKDLRNSIAHEYQMNKISSFFSNVKKYTPVLLDIIEKTNNYCLRYLEN